MAYADDTKTNLYCKLQVMTGVNQIRKNVGSYSGFYGDLESFLQSEFDLDANEDWSVMLAQPFFISCENPVQIEITVGTSTIQSTVESFTFVDFPTDNIKITNTGTTKTKIQVIYGV